MDKTDCVKHTVIIDRLSDMVKVRRDLGLLGRDWVLIKASLIPGP